MLYIYNSGCPDSKGRLHQDHDWNHWTWVTWGTSSELTLKPSGASWKPPWILLFRSASLLKFISTPPSNYAFALENCIYIGFTYVMCFFRSSELGSANGMNFYQGTSDCCREAFTPISRLKSAYILLILATSLSSVYPQPLEDRWPNTFRFR